MTTGTPTTNTTIVVGLNLPFGVQILSGTATSAITGAPVRHLWTGDAGGLCRIDPEIDAPGPFAVNLATCITGAGADAKFVAGRMAFDPLTNNIYTVNNGNLSNVARYHYLPGGDSGQGLVSTTAEILGDANGCGLSGNFPWSISLGPDGNLYVGFRKNGNVIRVLAPQSASVPCANMQVMGQGFDHKITKSLAWIGHDLWGEDVVGLWRIGNADQCFTPVNNFTPCQASALFRAVVPNGFSMVTDQAYPATNGNNLYTFDATGTTIDLLTGLAGTNPIVTLDYSVSILTGLTITIDNANPANQILYLGADPGVDTGIVGTGTVIKVTLGVGGPPAIPVNARATPGNGQATVSWSSGGGGAPTSYTVHNSSASNGITVPDAIVTAPAGFTNVPTSVVVSLTNGVTYQFQISASNASGTSGFSAPSNPVTPFAPTVPGAPTAVSAVAGDGQATISWSKPASDGGSPITSYSVSALVGGLPAGIGVFIAAPATSGTVTNLTNGTTYTFTVHATNAVGNSAESAPSNAVTPVIPLGPTDMAIGVTGPASDNPGGNATYNLLVTNLGPNFAPSVTVSDPIPSGAAFVSATTTQGICIPPTQANAVVQCVLASMLPGASATVSVTLSLQATTTDSASVQAFDSGGVPLSDPNPANNTGFATTVIGPPPTTTDIQVTGAAQNGGPAVGAVDTYTWQIKNATSIQANQVTFTTGLPASLQFSSISTNLGSCQGPAPGASGTITCTAESLGGGQTMIVVVNVNVAAAGTIPVTGSATFNGTDTNAANNAFTVTINAK
ncbi:MAG TPA: fibronectin type III domain-containing protein [Candidatus Angelobacter sp.]|nr:fibronectin type III domain-containing protein [Candidatus Angelobacter sp.]